MARMYIRKHATWMPSKHANSNAAISKVVTNHLRNWGGVVWCSHKKNGTGETIWLKYSQWSDFPTIHHIEELPKTIQLMELMQ